MDNKRIILKSVVWKWFRKKIGNNRLLVLIQVLLDCNAEGYLRTSIRKLSTDSSTSLKTVRYFVEKPIKGVYTAQSTAQKFIEIHIEKPYRFVEISYPQAQPMAQLGHSPQKNLTPIDNSSLSKSLSSSLSKDLGTNVPSNNKTVAKVKLKKYDFRKQEKPRETPDVTKVVLAWKKMTKVNGSSPGWDKNLWPRHAKCAKQLIELMGDWKEAVRCMYWVWEWCSRKRLTCTIDTVVKHTDTYLREKDRDDDLRDGYPKEKVL